MDELLEHQVYSTPVVEFVKAANFYCEFVEKTEGLSLSDFIGTSQKILTLLYLQAVNLPDIEKLFEEATETFVTETDWTYVKNTIAAKLGTHEMFVDVYHPNMQESDDATNISLAECFADAYQDLKDFVTNYRIGTTSIMNDALWRCKLNFEEYWGIRILAVLQALHNIFYSATNLDKDEENTGATKNYAEAAEIDTSNWLINNLFENQ